jgi:hypothetical protein
MFLKITQADGTYVLIPTNYVTNVSVSAAHLITGVEYLDGAGGAAPVTVAVTGITQTDAIRYDIGDLTYGPVFSSFLSSRLS